MVGSPFWVCLFDLGASGEPNGILLDGDAVRVDVGGVRASYVVFLHGVENRVSNYQEGLADFAMDGNELGDHVSDYVLEYADGESEETRILRRFAIQQSRIGWGASAFAAMPAAKPGIVMGATDEHGLGRRPASAYGRAETRHSSGRDGGTGYGGQAKLWVYALPNPHPEKPIGHLTLVPKNERSLVLGIAHTQVADHPLRPGVRQKLKLVLPEGAQLNGNGELEDIDIDLGVVMSARAVLDYDAERWLGAEVDVQPEQSSSEVVVEYIAHPQGKLYVGAEEDGEGAGLRSGRCKADCRGAARTSPGRNSRGGERDRDAGCCAVAHARGGRGVFAAEGVSSQGESALV